MATATEADSMQGEDGGGGWTGSVSGGALHLCAHILMFQVMFFKGIVKFQINWLNYAFADSHGRLQNFFYLGAKFKNFDTVTNEGVENKTRNC